MINPEITHTEGDIRQYWLDKDDWPFDTPSHLFLGRAVDLVGKRLFKAAWSGTEPSEPIYPLLPPTPESLPDAVLHHVDRLLQQESPTYKPRRLSQSTAVPSLNRLTAAVPLGEAPTFSPSDWEVACDLSASRNATSVEGQSRFGTVKRRLAEAFAAGAVATAVRPYRGGDLVSLPVTAWSTERWQPRFHFCRLNPRDLFDASSFGADHWLIFVETRSLDAAFPETQPTQSRASHDQVLAFLQGLGEKLGKQPDQKTAWRAVQKEFGERSPLYDSVIASLKILYPERGRGRPKKPGNFRE